MIGKHLGMFTEKVELTGANGGPVEVSNISSLELNELLALEDIMAKANQKSPLIENENENLL